eukprot:TRINITY_DN299_c0_g2_i1.p1 TRINITY_DN299_c0_g2~~TRINITY_DN299_c0_g2_i1.p1  ORF type:complete len:431 (+),score=175.41 TRINITY_DN299_c0_g2_i1:45-1337(+)
MEENEIDDIPPPLVRINPKERHKLAIRSVVKSAFENDGSAPNEFSIEVVFSKALPLSAVRAAFSAALYQQPTGDADDVDIAEIVHVDAVDSQGRQRPLLVPGGDGFDSDSDDTAPTPVPSTSGGRSKKRPAPGGAHQRPAVQRVRAVCVWLELITPAITGRSADAADDSDDSDNWEDDDGADQQRAQGEDEQDAADSGAEQPPDDPAYFPPEIVSRSTLDALVRKVGACTASLDKAARVSMSPPSASEAAAHAEQLAELVHHWDDASIQILVRIEQRSPDGEPAAGAQAEHVFDTLGALGMRYDAHSRDFSLGDDDAGLHLFSARLRTAAAADGTDAGQPKAFDPARMSSVSIEQVVFSCFVPLSPSGTVVKLMLPAAQFVAQRTCGTLLNADNAPLKLREIKEDVEAVEKAMRKLGVLPGSPTAACLWS